MADSRTEFHKDVVTAGGIADLATVKTAIATMQTDTATIKADTATIKADTALIKADIATIEADTALIKADIALMQTAADNVAPIDSIVAITPSDDNDLAVIPCRSIYVGVAGDLKITTPNDEDVILDSLAAGIWHPVKADRIWATGTAATDILAGY